MRIGFTGTSKRQQDAQLEGLKAEFLRLYNVRLLDEFHHGDCINADSKAHAMVLVHTNAKIVIHPPMDSKARAFCSGGKGVKWRKPKPYLERNHDIVDETDELIACPRSKLEQQRSGTWATIRYARKMGKPITIVFPDGRIKRELPNERRDKARSRNR